MPEAHESRRGQGPLVDDGDRAVRADPLERGGDGPGAPVCSACGLDHERDPGAEGEVQDRDLHLFGVEDEGAGLLTSHEPHVVCAHVEGAAGEASEDRHHVAVDLDGGYYCRCQDHRFPPGTW